MKIELSRFQRDCPGFRPKPAKRGPTTGIILTPKNEHKHQMCKGDLTTCFGPEDRESYYALRMIYFAAPEFATPQAFQDYRLNAPVLHAVGVAAGRASPSGLDNVAVHGYSVPQLSRH